MKRLIDIETGDIHVEGGTGDDVAFCGASMDGENGDAPMIETTRHKITCATCIQLIDHAKSIPEKMIKR